jgi:hypothetical protein
MGMKNVRFWFPFGGGSRGGPGGSSREAGFKSHLKRPDHIMPLFDNLVLVIGEVLYL